MYLQLMVVNFFIFVGVKQLKSFFDFMFLVLGEFSPLLALGFVCGKISSGKTWGRVKKFKCPVNISLTCDSSTLSEKCAKQYIKKSESRIYFVKRVLI